MRPLYGLSKPVYAAGIAVLFFLVILVSSCEARRSEQYRLEADAYFKLGRLQEAAELYQEAIVVDSSNAMAKLGYGRCLKAEHKFDEALAIFQEVLSSAPQTGAAYLETSNLLLDLDRPDEAIQLASQYTSLNPEQGGLLLGRTFLVVGRSAEALATLSTLNERFPNSADIKVNLALACLAQGQAKEAETLLRKVLGSVSTTSTAARVALVDVYETLGKSTEMVAELEDMLARAPENEDTKSVLARSQVVAGQLTEGESRAREAVTTDPSSGWANYAMGFCMLQKGANEEATGYLQRAFAVLPQETQVQMALRRAQNGSSAARGATTHASGAGLKTEGTPPLEIPKDWRTLWKQSVLNQLLEGHEGFLKEGGENLRETLVAAAIFTGKHALAEELAQSLAEDSPLRLYLRALKEGNREDALKAVETWSTRDDDLGLLGQNALGYAMALSGAHARALQALTACNQRWPDNAVSLFNTAQVFRMAGMSRHAASVCRRISTEYPSNSEAHGMLFAILRSSGHEYEACRAAETAYAIFPGAPEAALNLSQSYLDLRRLDEAKDVLSQAFEAAPGKPELRLGLANILLHEGKPDECLDLIAGETSSPNWEGQTGVLSALCYTMMREWEPALEKATSIDGASQQPTAQLIRFSALLNMGKSEDAVASLLPTDTAKPSGDRAGLILMQAVGHPAAGISDAESALAAELSRDAALVSCFALGATYQSAGLHDDALEAFQDIEPLVSEGAPCLIRFMFTSMTMAARLQDVKDGLRSLAQRHAAVPGAWLNLAAALRALDDDMGERESLDKALEAGPNDPSVSLQRGMYFERKNDAPSAINEYQRFLTLRPDDPIGNNNLAYCLLTTGGDAQKALECALRAARKLPQDPHVMHTLGVAQLRLGDLAESKKNLTAAFDRLPGDPAIALDLGQLSIQEGDSQKGRQLATAALAYADYFDLNFSRKQEADEILARPPVQEPANGQLSQAGDLPSP